MTDTIVTGERLQELCPIYCGVPDDFQYNPRIFRQTEKHFDLSRLSSPWNNPSVLFCYAHRLPLFMEKRHYIMNPYTLVTHNSDENIKEQYIPLLDDPKLIRMFSQNICIHHPKLHLIPIGIANSMWAHGNLEILGLLMTFHEPKSRDVYFYFNVDTNRNDRELCYREISAKGLVFEQPKPHVDFLKHLSTHKFAVCPEGNGIDSHRIWECYYLGVIPIVHTSVFTRKLREILPCILLDKWSDFDMGACLQHYTVLYEELQAKRELLSIGWYENKFKQV